MKTLFSLLTLLVILFQNVSVLRAQDSPSLDQKVKELKGSVEVLENLRFFWGEKFPEKFKYLFTGPDRKVVFLTPQAMQNLLGQLCGIDRGYCKDDKYLVVGLTLTERAEGNPIKTHIYIAHGLVHPLLEAATILHEECHLEGNSSCSDCEKRKLPLLKNRLGDAHMLTMRLARAEMRPVLFQGQTYFQATTQAVAEFRQALEKKGHNIPDDPHNNQVMADLLELIVNGQ